MAAWYQAIHAAKRFKLGTKKSQDGKEYIYLAGVASNTANSWVHIVPTAGSTTAAGQLTPVLAVADGQGPLAISMAANTSATNYSWYQIYGISSGLVLASFDGTNGAFLCLTATAGSLDDADVAGDTVFGAAALTDRDTTLGTSTFFLSYPFTIDVAAD